MMRTILIPAALAGLLALLASSQVHAYGAVHAGYTTTGAGGVQHTSATVGANGQTSYHTGSTQVGPNGGVEHTGTTTGPNGGSATTTRAYSPSAYNNYSATGGAEAYKGGVVRYP